MKRLTGTPKVALIFYYCCLSQFRPTCIKKPFSKKRESILSFLPGEFSAAFEVRAKTAKARSISPSVAWRDGNLARLNVRFGS